LLVKLIDVFLDNLCKSMANDVT